MNRYLVAIFLLTLSLLSRPEGWTAGISVYSSETRASEDGDIGVLTLYSNEPVVGGPLEILPDYIAGMAGNVVTFTNKSDSTGGVQLTWDHTIGGNKLKILLVAVQLEDATSAHAVVSTVTYGGVAMTRAAFATQTSEPSEVCRSEIWYLLDRDMPAGPTHSVVVTTAGNCAMRIGHSASFHNVKQEAPEAISINSQNAPSSPFITTITNLTSNALLIDSMVSGSQGTSFSTNHVNQFKISEVGTTGTKGVMSVRGTGSPGVYPMGWNFGTNGASRVAHVVISIAPAAGLSINFTMSGTATNGVDYVNIPNNLVIPAGDQYAKVFVRGIPGGGVEDVETVTLTLTPDAAYDLVVPTNTTINLHERSLIDRERRYIRGTTTEAAHHSSVIPIDMQRGVLLDDNGGNAEILFPWNLWTNTFYHHNLTNAASVNPTNFTVRIPFENAIVAFGERVGGSPLYIGNQYHFGAQAGLPTSLSLKTWERVGDAVNYLGETVVSFPKQSITNDWIQFQTNGFAHSFSTNGITTTIGYRSSAIYPRWGSKFGSFQLTHTGSSDSVNKIYQIGIQGEAEDGSPLVVDTQGDAVHSPLYVMEFIQRPPWRAAFIDQPHFQGEPAPPIYSGKSVTEVLQALPASSTINLSNAPSTYITLDQSPELRRHPILDQFVADLRNDPMKLAAYVQNEIELTDPISYSDNSNYSEIAINPGGVSRGALATFQEGQGSALEQCALLVYLLRQAGVPAVYAFPAHNSLKLLDVQLSRMLRIQIGGAVDNFGAILTTNTVIPVNYPWVAAYVSNNWVHLFPWLKDTEVIEGLNLYDYMPSEYDNGFKWLRDYCFGKSNIMAYATIENSPLAIYRKFIEDKLAETAPGVSIEDIGYTWRNRRPEFSRWSDFPKPWTVPATNIALESFSSTAITNIHPQLTNIFDTVKVNVSCLEDPSIALITGEMRMVDLHNRRLLIRHRRVSSFNHRIYLALAPFKPGATGATNFTVGDSLLNSQEISDTLSSGDKRIVVDITYRRQRWVAPEASTNRVQYDSFLGVGSQLTITNQCVLLKGDLAAICLNYGRVSDRMLSYHAEELWDMERQLVENPGLTNSLPADLYQGGPAYLMGMSYYNRVSRFGAFAARLHKYRIASVHSIGLSILAARRSGGSLPNGEIYLVQPKLDVLEYTSTLLGNSTLRLDAPIDHVQARQNVRAILCAEGSASEHAVIDRFYGCEHSISTVKLLQLANTNGASPLVLNISNYVAKGAETYKGKLLREHDPALWKSITNFLSEDDAHLNIVYLTPGPVTNIANTYKGMGALLWSTYFGGASALISSNLNGGYGGESFGDSTMGVANAINYSLQHNQDNTYTLGINGLSGSQTTIGPDIFSGIQTMNVVNYASNGNYEYSPVQLQQMVGGLDLLGVPRTADLAVDFPVFFQSNYENPILYPADVQQRDSLIADPVHAVTGEFYVDSTDLTLPGPMPLSVRRNYSSHNLAHGHFGYGWKATYVPSLSLNSDEGIIYAAEPDGSVLAYLDQNIQIDSVSSNGSSSASTTLSWNHVVGNKGNRALIVTMQLEDGSSTDDVVQSITYGGTSLTRAGFAVETTTGIARSEIWYLMESTMPAAGTNAIVVTMAGTCDKRIGHAISFYNVAQGAPEAVSTNSQNSPSSPFNSSIVTLSTNAVIIDSIASGSETTVFSTSQSGQTELSEVGTTGSKGAMSLKLTTVPGTNQVGWAFSGGAGRLAHVVVALAPIGNSWVVSPEVNPQSHNNSKRGVGSTANRLRNEIFKEVVGTNTYYKLHGCDGGLRTFKVMTFTNIIDRTRPCLTEWRDNRGNSFSFEYGTDPVKPDYGEVRRIQSSNGSFLGFYYDVYGQIVEAYTGDGRRLYYDYDEFGDLISVTLPDASVIEFEYEHKNQSITNGGTVSVHAYSTHALVRENKPDGRVLVNQYDQHRRVTNQLATAGMDLIPIRNASFVYTNNFVFTNSFTNRISGSTHVSDVFNQVTKYEYTDGLITKITDPLSQTIEQTWYADDATVPGYPRSVHWKKDHRGLWTEYEYDANGNVTGTISWGDLKGAGDFEGATHTVTYNANNLPLVMTDSIGNKVEYVYNATYPFLVEKVIYYAGSNAIKTNFLSYHNVTNTFAFGGVTYTNFAVGLLQQEIRAYDSPDAATNIWDHDGRGYPTIQIQYTGTADPNVTNLFFYNDRGELIETTDSAGRSVVVGYDPLGRPTMREVYDTGQSQPMFWDYSYYNPNGELVWSDGPRYDPEDYVWRDYDGAGRKTVEILWQSRAKADGTGVEAETGDALFATSFNEYDGFGNLTKAIDPRGSYVTQQYDAIGQLTNQVFYGVDDIPLSTNKFAYEPGGLLSVATNALGGITQKFYTTTGKLKRQENPDGSTSEWRYYLDGRLKREIQSNGAYWENTYDDLNRTITRVFYTAGNSPLATNSIAMDRRGNQILITDNAENSTTSVFDGLDRVKSALGPAATYSHPAGAPASGAGAAIQQATTNYYDAAGIWITNVNALGEKTITQTDALGRTIRAEIRTEANVVVRETSNNYSANHHSVTNIQGSGGSVVSAASFTDTLGRGVLSITYPNTNVREFTINDYDLAGNLETSTRYSATNTSIVSWTSTAYAYDGLNRLRLKSDRDNAITSFDYDPAGNLTNRVMPGGLAWRATYNAAGQLLKEYNFASSTGARTNTYGYFSTGSPYIGLLKEQTNNLGVICTYDYDDWLRPSSSTHAGPLDAQDITTSWDYDVRGLCTNIVQNFANSATGPDTAINRSFDRYGQLLSESVSIGGTNLSTASQAWDASGRRLALGFGSFGYVYSWRANGALNYVGIPGGSGEYTYNTAGLLVSRSVGERETTITSRDGTGRPLGVETIIGANSIVFETLGWTGDGLLSSHQLVRDDFTDQRSYTYANLSRRLASEKFNLSSGTTWTNVFAFDGGQNGGAGILTRVGQTETNGALWAASTNALLRITGETSAMARRSANGRVNEPCIVSVFVDDKPMPVTLGGTNWQALLELSPGAHQIKAAATSPNGVYTTWASTNWFTNSATDQLEVTYNTDGQITQRLWRNGAGQVERTQDLAWDGLGRLHKLTERDSQNAGYNWQAVYDGTGRRLRTITTLVTSNNVAVSGYPNVTDQVYDPLVEFLELGVKVDGNWTWKLYGPDLNGSYGGLNGTGGLEATFASGTFMVGVSDLRGNLIASYDPVNITMRWDTSRPSGFGAAPGYRPPSLGHSNGVLLASAWRSRYSDVTGLMYLGARYYDSVGGHFLSADPLGHDSDASLYSFASGDPINSFDPDGRFGKAATSYAYNGGLGGDALRALGGYLNNYENSSELGGYLTGLAGTIVNQMAALVTPSTYVDGVASYGYNTGTVYHDRGAVSALSYAASSWNMGAVMAGVANQDQVTGEPIGDWYQRGAQISGGVAGTAGLAMSGLSLYNSSFVGVVSEPPVVAAEGGGLARLQGAFDNLADQHLLPQFRALDPNLKAGYTGSFKTGTVGNPSKATFGQPINLNKFDVDYWIESDILFQKFGPNLKANPEFRKILSETPGFEGLKPNKEGFSIKFKPSGG